MFSTLKKMFPMKNEAIGRRMATDMRDETQNTKRWREKGHHKHNFFVRGG